MKSVLNMTLKSLSRLILVVLIAMFVLSAFPVAAQNTGGLTMDVQAGFDGYYKENGLLPVFVTLTNEGALIEGELRIIQGDFGSGPRVVYSTPVSLPTQSNKRVPMYVYPGGFILDLTVELLDENGRSLLKSTSNPLSQQAQGDLLYGVVTPMPGNLDYLEDVTGDRSNAAVAYFQLEDLPDLPPAWNGLDVLVLHDVDTGQLNAGQRDALEKWLHTGGQIVVAGGAGWQKTAASLSDILPVAITSSEMMADLPALHTFTGEPFRDPGPYLVTKSSLTNGEMLLHEDGLPLLAKRPFGKGNVFFLALDPSLAPLLDWSGSEIVWAEVANSLPTLLPWASGFQNSWSAVEAVSSLPVLAMPHVLQLIAYLLVYVIVMGPVNYWVLRRKNRRELAWVTIPVMVLIFTGLAYLTGFQLKGNDTIINQVSVVTGEVGSEDMRVNTLLGLYSPRRQSYDVVLPADSMVQPLTDYSENPSLAAITRDSEVILTDVRVDVSGLETFMAESIRTAPPLTGQASLITQDGKIELAATIRNDSEQMLENVVLFVGPHVLELGDLDPGQERSASETVGSANESSLAPINPSGYGSALMQNAAAIVGTEDFYSEPVALSKYQLLQALEEEYLSGYAVPPNNSLMLTAWTDEAQLETAVQDYPFSSSATTLYLLEVPLRGQLQETQIVVPLTLLNWTILGSNNMYGESAMDFYMPGSSWMEVEFTPWRELAGLTVTDIEVHLESLDEQSNNMPSPSVRLWDWQAKEWLDLDDADWGQTAVPDPYRFLDEENTVRLRLQNTGQQDLYINQFFPSLSGNLE